MDLALCDIRVQCRLEGNRWSHWFEGLGEVIDGDSTTVLSGAVAGQAALHGLVGRVRDLGLILVSVERRGFGSEA